MKTHIVRYISFGIIMILLLINLSFFYLLYRDLAVELHYSNVDLKISKEPTSEVIIEPPTPTPTSTPTTNTIVKELPVEKTSTIKKKENIEVEAIITYLEQNGANHKLIELTPLIVGVSKMYDIDPLRTVSIIIHETGFGWSQAMQNNNNVCGMNWSSEQKQKIGIRSDIYNLAVEKTPEASVMNLVMLLVEYKTYNKPLEKLSEIQTIYAPTWDPRNGLSGMDNNSWTTHTVGHYNKIKNIIENQEVYYGI